MIEVRNLVKMYGNHLAVDHLSFTIEKGKIYGFLGPKDVVENMIVVSEEEVSEEEAG